MNELFSRFALRRADFFAALLTIALCGGEAYLLIGRNMLAMRQAAKESSELAARMKEIEGEQKLLAGGREKFEALQKTNAEFDKRFEVTHGFDRFYSEMLDKAEEHGLQLRGVSSSPGVLAKGILRIPIHLQLAGSYEQFYEFVRAIFGQPYVLKLESLTIMVADAGGCEFDLTLSLSKQQDEAGAKTS